MDGNGRWASERGLSRSEGHHAGTENVRRVIRKLSDLGVNYVTLYAFSTENWQRPPEEVTTLMGILRGVIADEAERLNAENVRILHVGRLDRIGEDVSQGILDAVELTKGNTGLTLALAYDYGGRSELVDAVRGIVASGTPIDEIDEFLVANHLYTSGIPDPDLVVRTAGEMRLSNFLLWQAAYAEYYSTAVFWPDFDEREAELAVTAYGQRQRRYGRVEDGQPD